MILLSTSSLRHNVISVCAIAFALLAMVVFVDAGAILGEERAEKDNPSSRSLLIQNESGRKVDMYWVNTFIEPEGFVPQFIEDGKTTGLSYGASKSVSSYIGHQFEVREFPSKRTGHCIFEKCRKFRIKVNDRNYQRVVINKDFSVTNEDDKETVYTKVDDMFAKCKQKAVKSKHPLESIDLITKCMEEQISTKFDIDREERSFHSKVHRIMETELTPFTCGDVNKTQSYEIKNTTWSYTDGDHDRKKFTMKTLHKLSTSEIFSVEDFISNETCDALKIYRHIADHGDIVGVPSIAALEKTKQGKLLNDLFYKMYELLMDRFGEWPELDFVDDMLFEYIKDPRGFKTPEHLCTTQEEVHDVVDAMEAGKPPKCLIPGGVPKAVPTKHIIVEDGKTFEEKLESRQVAQLFIFCDEPKQQLGGLHFPYAGVHTTAKVGKLVVAVHRHPGDQNDGFDGYVNEYHMCPNHEVYVHTVTDHNPNNPEAETDDHEL